MRATPIRNEDRTRVRRVVCLAAYLTSALSACGETSESEGRATVDVREERPEPDATAAAEELEALRALGYAGYTESSTDEAGGVVSWDRERSYPGYNLFATRNSRKAELIDAEGAGIRSWSLAKEGHWERVRLLANGDVLVIGSDLDPPPGKRNNEAGRFLARLSWDNELRWLRHGSFHHDVAEAPGERLLTLSFHYEIVPEIHPSVQTRLDSLTFVNAEGEVVEKVSLYDVLRDQGELFTVQNHKPVGKGDEAHVDLFHTNTVSFMRAIEGRSHPMYAADHVLVTIRNQDAVVVINLATEELVWAFGPGEMVGPHDGRLLDNGHILVFDNGLGRNWSRVLEVDPLTGKIVWEMRAPEPSDFYSPNRGGAQRLPNGNTLISSSVQAEAFEVTPDGETVWRFLNPTLNDDGERSTMNRTERHGVAFIEGLLQRHARSE